MWALLFYPDPAFEPGQNGGYGIVQGGQMYEKLGVADSGEICHSFLKIRH